MVKRIRRGDVFWVELPGGRRPAVVITRDAVLPLLNRVAVAPITKTSRGIPAEVAVSRIDGMRDDSVVSLDNIQVVLKISLGSRITTLSSGRMDEICQAINYALGCS